MRFKRNTHDENGNPRYGLPTFEQAGMWPTCDIQMLGNEPRSVQEIYDEHEKYDDQYWPDGYGYTLPDIMEGLAHLIRLGVVVAVDSDD